MITTLILFAVFCPSSSTPIPTPKLFWRRESCGRADSSNARTTQDIVWSCVATLFACVWVAIHPNLPDLSISAWSRFKQRTGIMILAIFAPEFILIWALRQRIGAGRIVKEYNRDVPKVVGDRKSLWTLTHGFYVQMGSFVLYNKEIPLRVLHFRDMLELLRLGMVDHPTVTEEDICYRSKGDFLTKLLVVVQITWFVIQCAARWAAGLPVTELEIINLAFATLNIIILALVGETAECVYRRAGAVKGRRNTSAGLKQG